MSTNVLAPDAEALPERATRGGQSSLKVLGDDSNELSPAMRRLLTDIFADLRRLEQRIRDLTREIAAVADREDVARASHIPHCSLEDAG